MTRASIVLASATLWGSLSCLPAQTKVNPDAALVQDFEQRIQSYLKVRKSAEDGLPPLKVRENHEITSDRQHELAERLRSLRSQAAQGDIFAPAIAKEMRRLIGIAMEGSNGARVRKSFRSAEPVLLQLKVNGPFPEKLPLQSTPPTLLMNLPHLPPELDYRFAAGALVLRDAAANLIVDFVPDAIQAR